MLKDIPKLLITHSMFIVAGVVLLTVFFFASSLNLHIGEAGLPYDTLDKSSLKSYMQFRKNFGDDPLLFAVRLNEPAFSPEAKQALVKMHKTLEAHGNIDQVIDITSFDSERLHAFFGIQRFWSRQALTRLRTVLPGLNNYVSNDFKVVAFSVRFPKTDVTGLVLSKQINDIKSLISKGFPGRPECHAIGYPVMKAAFERYNLENTATYIALGLFVGTLVALYIFKSLIVTAIVVLSCIVSIIWTIGLMALSGMALSIATGLSLCLILVVTTTTVMHIVSKYYELIPKMDTSIQALEKTLDIVFRPCLMCALTTSVGFASLLISPVPMIQEAGVMISIGVLNAFFVALMVTVFILTRMNPPMSAVLERIQNDRVSLFTGSELMYGIRKPATTLWLSLILVLVLLYGAFKIQKSTDPAFPVLSDTPEAKSMAFFRNHFLTGYPLSLIVEPAGSKLTSSSFWKQLGIFEQTLESSDIILSQDSISPLIGDLVRLSPMGWQSCGLVVQALLDTPETEDLVSHFIAKNRERVRIIVHLSSQDSRDLDRVIEFVGSKAKAALDGVAAVTFNGRTVLSSNQMSRLVDMQLRSLVLALALITLLMMIQLRSLTLGFISLIPNALPLLSMLGLMGILNIHLDPLMIFAAIVSFGLSVDDSIHFLTQLKREFVRDKGNPFLLQNLEASYRVTSRALLSTTTVLCLSSLSYLLSSFEHVFSLGVLIASASAAALFGDLVLLPAVILKMKPIQNVLLKHKGI